MKNKKIEVYVNLDSNDILVGYLFVDILKGKECYSFEFEKNYLKNPHHILIDPNLMDTGGRQYSFDSTSKFGFMADAIPDRWGKNLLNKKELIKAKEENRQPEKLGDSDYLLRISDYTRQGALRFKISGDEQFSSYKEKNSVPTILFLNKLEHLAYDVDIYDDDEIKDLLSPGSSLGGARPKASIFDNEGNLYIAKFAHKQDEYDVSKMEMLANLLAIECGLNVSECKLVNGKHSIFLSKRFDRCGERRIHYISAMTLLGASDGDSDSYSYLDLVDLINKYSNNIKNDLIELFKRMVFNCLIHNSDDHLRNHGFIYKNNGYQLSPLFDINPNSYSNGLTLSIDGFEHSFNLTTCENVSKYFGLKRDDAVKIIQDLRAIIKQNTPKIAKKLSIKLEILKRFDYLINN